MNALLIGFIAVILAAVVGIATFLIPAMLVLEIYHLIVTRKKSVNKR